jgi:hypothetical protein
MKTMRSRGGSKISTYGKKVKGIIGMERKNPPISGGSYRKKEMQPI